MKTLSKLFHKDLLKKWATISVLVFLATYTFMSIEDKKNAGAILKFLSIVCSFIILLAPFSIFIINNFFKKNLHWLINSNFNRKELINFYLFSQTLRVVLFIATLIGTYLILYFIDSSINEMFNSPEYISYSDIFTFYVATTFILFVFYSLPLSKFNHQNRLQAKLVNPRSLKSKLGVIILLLVTMTVVFLLLNATKPPLVVFICFLSAGTFSMTIMNFSNSFRILQVNRLNKAFFLMGAIGLIPVTLLLILVKLETQNPDLTYKQKLDSVLLLKNLNKSYSNEEKVGFLLVTENRSDLTDLLKLYGKTLSKKQVFDSITSQEKMSSLTRFLGNKLSEIELEEVINFAENFKKTKKVDSKFDYYFSAFFMKQKASNEYIIGLLESNSSLKQLAGFSIAAKNMEPQDFINLYERYKESTSKSIWEDRNLSHSLKRAQEKVKDSIKPPQS